MSRSWQRGFVMACIGLLLSLAAARVGAGGEREAGPRTVDIRVRSNGETLSGTLLLPAGTGLPAVVLVPGSGPLTREGGRRFPMFRSLAEALARRGIAVLRYDKRGTGASGGDWRRETFDDRAADVRALIGVLRDRPEVDATRIGVVGHSQGGWIAQLVAADRGSGVAHVVLLAGPAVTVREQVVEAARNDLRLDGLPADRIEGRLRRLRVGLGLASVLGRPCRRAAVHYLCFIVDYDPVPALRRIRVPLLALYAERDPLVPPETNIPRLRQGLVALRPGTLAVATLPGVNHWFVPAHLGSTREFMRMPPPLALAPEVADRIGAWVHAWRAPRRP